MIFQMLLAGRRTHKNKAFFMDSRGVLWVRIMGSQNVMGSDYGSNIGDCGNGNIRIVQGDFTIYKCSFRVTCADQVSPL